MDKKSKSTNKARTTTNKANHGMNRTEFAQEYSIETGKKADKNCNKDCDHKKGGC